jgi:transcriptional regulator with XRE-family HTH domain
VTDLNNLTKFLDDPYRDSYLEGHVKGSIAYQIQALRQKSGLNQTDFGELVGMPQSVISRIESTEYGTVSINTLLRIATKLKIGLSVRFCDYPTLIKTDLSPHGMIVDNIDETVAKVAANAKAAVARPIAVVQRARQLIVIPKKSAANETNMISAETQGSGSWQTTLNLSSPLAPVPGSETLNTGTFIPILPPSVLRPSI